MRMANKEMTFEQAMNRLGEIVTQLQDGSVALDDSLKLFEEGLKLSKLCDDKLKAYEGKVKELSEAMTDDKG